MLPHSRAKKLTQPAPAAKTPIRTIGPPLFKADTANLAFSADKEGKVRMVYSGWEDAKVLLAGGRFEVSARRARHCAQGDPGICHRKHCC